MKKRKAVIVSLLFITIMVPGLWSKECNFHIDITGGLSTIYSEYSPKVFSPNLSKYYYAFNYGFVLNLNKNLIDFNIKFFEENRTTLLSEVTNEVTGKEFLDISLKYGRSIFTFMEIDLNAFVGAGYIKRKVNRAKAYPHRVNQSEFITLPLKISLNRLFFRKLGFNISLFCDLNLKENLGGLETNLFLRFK